MGHRIDFNCRHRLALLQDKEEIGGGPLEKAPVQTATNRW
jgi:hypothetical protein